MVDRHATDAPTARLAGALAPCYCFVEDGDLTANGFGNANWLPLAHASANFALMEFYAEIPQVPARWTEVQSNRSTSMNSASSGVRRMWRRISMPKDFVPDCQGRPPRNRAPSRLSLDSRHRLVTRTTLRGDDGSSGSTYAPGHGHGVVQEHGQGRIGDQ